MGEKSTAKEPEHQGAPQTQEKKKKKKGIAKIKGLFKGRTKKKTKKAAESASVASTDVDAETNSIHPIENQNENAAGTVGASPALAGFDPAMLDIPEEEGDEYNETGGDGAGRDGSVCLQIVLLLMDPSTRRFELLQLEFDSDKARVSDILAQVPLSVTEEAIRERKYRGVCDRESKEQGPDVKLVDICNNRDVLVALPDDLPVDEVARLARPILCDEKVINMLQTCGIDTTPWRNAGKGEETVKKDRELLEIPEIPAPSKKANKGMFPLLVVLCALLAILVQGTHNYISAPITVGRPVPPGTWRSKCGLLGVLSGCENMFMEVDDEGNVNFFDTEQEMIGQMTGKVCEDEEDCIDGVVLNEDMTVDIGGKTVYYLYSYSDDMSITPWPFVEEPKMKSYRYKQRKVKD